MTRAAHRVRLPAALLLLCAAPAAAQSANATQAPTGTPAAAARPPLAERLEGTGPNGAAMRCRDGSFHPADAAPTACDARGGVLVRFPLKRTPIAPPPAARKPASVPESEPLPGAALQAPTTSRANVLVPAERPPAGATIQCRDGTFVVSDTASARCNGRGGVRFVFPVSRAAPRTP